MSKLIPLRGKYGKGKFAIVDDTDFDTLSRYKWRMGSKGYAQRGARKKEGAPGKTFYMHQMLLPPRPGHVTDHRNRNRLDNRRANLRYATRAQNATNATPRQRGTSKFRGVNYNKIQGKWHARIGYDNKVIHLGFFATEEEAARVRDGAALFYHGPYAVLNFP